MDIYKDKKTPHLILQKKKIYRFNANNSCLFSVSRSPKKSNSSCSFKEKISGSHKRVSSSLAILL